VPALLLFHRLFIANRGEVAVRIAQAADALGITPVFGVSEADRDAPYTRGREVVVLGKARATESYLNRERVVQAAVQSGCTALHPGWGFLAEDPVFASLVEAHGVTFVGPPAHVMAAMGKKTPAKRAMAAAGLGVIEGSEGVLADAEQAAEVAASVGFPILLKAESGGGGRGMRIARSLGDVHAAYGEAQAESAACFGDSRLYLERLLERGRHVEVQLLADRYGNVVHLGARDCSVQRNHQKLIEESPAPTVEPAEMARTFEAAVRATRDIGYVGAGTMEFLLAEDGRLRFMEMNTRLQVEHGVSELLMDVDLVTAQLRIAAGARLELSQEQLKPRGHVIECRINAEDPARGFAPTPGKVTRFGPPLTPEGARGDIRVDTHAEPGYVVGPHYDSLLAKLLVRGADREDARKKMIEALDAFVIEGVSTTIPFHRAVLSSEAFSRGEYFAGELPGFTAPSETVAGEATSP